MAGSYKFEPSSPLSLDRQAQGETMASAKAAVFESVGENLMARAVVGFSPPAEGPHALEADKLISGASDQELGRAFIANVACSNKLHAARDTTYVNRSGMFSMHESPAHSALNRGTALLSHEIHRRGFELPTATVGAPLQLTRLEDKLVDAYEKSMSVVLTSSANMPFAALSAEAFILPPENAPGRKDLEETVKIAGDMELAQADNRNRRLISDLEFRQGLVQRKAAMDREGLIDVPSPEQRSFAIKFSKMSAEERLEASGTVGLSKPEAGFLAGLREGSKVMEVDNKARAQIVLQEREAKGVDISDSDKMRVQLNQGLAAMRARALGLN